MIADQNTREAALEKEMFQIHVDSNSDIRELDKHDAWQSSGDFPLILPFDYGEVRTYVYLSNRYNILLINLKKEDANSTSRDTDEKKFLVRGHYKKVRAFNHRITKMDKQDSNEIESSNHKLDDDGEAKP